MKYTKQQKLVIDYMYRSLKASGYDDVSIAGILGNALTESSLDPDSVSASKMYHGIFQNDKNIRKAVIDKYGDYSLKSQMKYAHDWVTGADWVRRNPYTLTNAGKYKKSGYKNVHEASDAWSHMYERAVITDKDGKVIGYQNDPTRRANAAAMYDYINNSYNGGMKIINTDRGGKKLVVPLTEYENPTEYEPEWKLSLPTKTVYPLNNTVPESISSWSGADAPNATPRLKDFLEMQNEDKRPIWNAYELGAVAEGRKSPFKLSLSLPSLDSMMQMNSPLRLMEQYFADVLGINNLIPQESSLFPRFKNGKLPKFEGGKNTIGSNVNINNNGIFTDDYTRAFDDLIVTPKGSKVVPGSLYKYLKPWDDYEFINAITLGGLNNLSPTLWARRMYDASTGNLTMDSWLNGNNGIVSNKFAKNHPYYSMLINAVGDGLIGASTILSAKILNQLRPQNLGKHFYYNVNPQGYDNIIKLAKGIAKTVLKGSEPDIGNPVWDIPGAFKVGASEYGVPEDVFRKARIDAWRMHTNIPQKYNTFTPSKRVSGAYTAERDVARMMEPDILEDENIIKMLKEDKGVGIDFFNGSGGNVGFVNYDLGRTLNGDKLGVLVTDDVWDVLPFSRINQGKGLGSRLTEHTTQKILKKILPIKHKVTKKLDDLSYNDDIEGYKKWAAQHPYEAEYIDPREVFSTERKIKPVLDLAIKTINKGTTKISDFDRWLRKTLNNKAKNFEVGSLYKGSPFRVINEFPYTRALNVNNLGQMNPGAIYSYWGGFDTKNILPTLANDYRLKGILPVNIGDNIPSQLKYK